MADQLISDKAVEQHLSAMEDARILYCDTESTGLKVKDGRDYLTGISVAYDVGDLGLFDVYYPFRHVDENIDPKYIARIARLFDIKPLIFHNLKHDLHTLATIGIHPKGQLYDTMMLAHMVNEEWPSKELDWLAKILLKDSKQMSEQLQGWIKAFGWDTIPARLMAPYAAHDARLLKPLFDLLWRRLVQENMKDLWPIEADYCKLLVGMERVGVRVNKPFCEYKVEIGEDRMEEIRDDLGWNPASSIDLGKFLLKDLGLPIVETTPGGKPSFNKKAMQQYDEMLLPRVETAGDFINYVDTAKKVLEYRGWQKAVSSLYRPALELVSPDGRIRPNFKQHGTVTGRLSCEQPNLQQIPRSSDYIWNGDAKNAFIAKDGFTLLEFDYAQLEFRLATAYGQDDILLESFNRGEDVFIPIANDVFGGPEFRQSAKTLTYSLLYGAGISRLMVALGVSQASAESIRSKFYGSYPGIYAKSELARRNVESKGYVRYWTGRRRHLKKNESHKAFNSCVQGGAAELVKRSMLRVSSNVAFTEDVRMVLTVHDSIVLEVKHGLEKSVIDSVIPLMTDWPEFGVKLDVDVNVWGRKDGLQSLQEATKQTVSR